MMWMTIIENHAQMIGTTDAHIVHIHFGGTGMHPSADSLHNAGSSCDCQRNSWTWLSPGCPRGWQDRCSWVIINASTGLSLHEAAVRSCSRARDMGSERFNYQGEYTPWDTIFLKDLLETFFYWNRFGSLFGDRTALVTVERLNLNISWQMSWKLRYRRQTVPCEIKREL